MLRLSTLFPFSVFKHAHLLRISLFVLVTRQSLLALTLAITSFGALAAVGTTRGAGAIDVSGLAGYRIPIELPQGPGGVTPQLSVAYSQGSGAGLLGQQWQLEGLSALTRCPATQAQDGAPGSINMNANDRYCLDGSRLRLVSGAYGQDGSMYRAELNGFSLVTAHGSTGYGPVWFEVLGKDGLTYEYGNSNTSRATGVIGSVTITHTWALSKVRDRASNVAEYKYVQDGGNVLIERIEYASNANTGAQPQYSVVFEKAWEGTLNDPVNLLNMMFSGTSLSSASQLGTITVYKNGPYALGWGQESWVTTYQFNYLPKVEAETPRPRLAAVQRCIGMPGAEDCLEPVTFTYSATAANWSSSTGVSAPTSAASGLVGDINGDGYNDSYFFDSVCYSDGEVFLGCVGDWKVLWGSATGPSGTSSIEVPVEAWNSDSGMATDVDSDGRLDLLLAGSDGKWWWVHYTAGGTFAVTSTNTARLATTQVVAADVDGDGYQDIVSIAPGGTGLVVQYHNHDGSAGFETGTNNYYLGGVSLTGLSAGDPSNPKHRTMDINGDGRDDLVATMYAPPNFYGIVIYSTGNGFATGELVSTSVVPIDQNADRCTDLMSVGVPMYLYISKCGQGLSPAFQLWTLPSIPHIADWNGDGMDDLVYMHNGEWKVALSYGGLWKGVAAFNGAEVLAPIDAMSAQRIADFDGDGFPDTVYADNSGGVHFRRHQGILHPEYLQSATDGFGSKFTFNYKPTSPGNCYSGTSVAPALNTHRKSFNDSRFVACSMAITDGVGGEYALSFNYYNAKLDLQGRGFLGYERRTMTDSRNGFLHEQTFRQDFPFIGEVIADRLYRANLANLISSTTNTFTSTTLDATLNNQRYFAVVSQSASSNYEVGGAKDTQQIASSATSYLYDTYGNVTRATSTATDFDTGSPWYGQSWSSVTASTITNYPSTWCLGLPEQTTVTKTLPDGSSQVQTVAYTVDSSACRATQQVVEPNTTALKAVSNYGFDACGNVNATQVIGKTSAGVDMASRTTGANFGAACASPQTVTVTNALNQSGSMTLNHSLGVKLSETDANGIAINWSYDGFGRKTRESRPDGTSTDWVYTRCSSSNNYCGSALADSRWAIEQTDRDSSTSIIRTAKQWVDSFDRARRVATQTATGGYSYVDTTYDVFGRTRTQSNPYTAVANGYIRFSYDLIGRPTTTELVTAWNSVDRQSSAAYAGRYVWTTDAKNYVTEKLTDIAGELRRVTDPSPGGVTQYSYTFSGNNRIDTVTDAALNVMSVTTNVRGFKIATSDPDMGNWIYTFNSLGELESQRNAKNQTVSFTYDALGRSIQRVEPEGTTNWTWGASTANKNIGRLSTVTSPSNYNETHTYDTIGRPQGVTYGYGADGSYQFDYAYNNLGLLDTLTYPVSTAANRLKVQNLYTNGHLTQVKEFGGAALWTLNMTDERNLPIDESLGNGVRIISGFDPLTGDMTYRQSGNAGSTSNLQNLSYAWDKGGNLSQRQDVTQAITEAFTYDSLDRLTQSTRNGTVNLTVAMNAIGNVTSKTGAGAMNYGTNQTGCTYYTHKQPHAVRKAGSTIYCYDANGNMVKRGANSVTWTSYNLPSNIVQGTSSSQFLYGANRNRFKQIASYSGASETTIYAGGLLEKTTVASGTLYRHYIQAGSSTVVYTRSTAQANPSINYVTTDHLGSSSAITNATGSLVVKESFDAYGKRRGTTWTGNPTAANLTAIGNATRHGFTGHEHLDNLALIHMNGRVYDPTLGRFMSADPHVTDPTFSQSLNRYSYVWNNPLSMTDPTGFDSCRACATDKEGSPRDHDGDQHNDPTKSICGSSFFCTSIGGYWTHSYAGKPGDDGSTPLGAPGTYLSSTWTTVNSALDGALNEFNEYSSELMQGTLNAIPGWYFTNQSVVAWNQGRYLESAALYAGAFGDVFLLGRGSAANTAVRTVAAPAASAAANAPRGMSKLGGVFTSEVNTAGGTVVTSVGKVSQNDVATIVNSALYDGKVNILTGVHGSIAGSTSVDVSLFVNDVARFGNLPGVVVYDFSTLAPGEINSLLNGVGTTIGAFCDSGACLAPFK